MLSVLQNAVNGNKSTTNKVVERRRPKKSQTQDGEQSSESQRSELQKFCKELLAKRSKADPVPCRQCGSQLKLFTDGKYLQTVHLIDHASLHMENPMYLCRYCNYETYSRNCVKHHIAAIHKLKGEDFDNLIPAHDKEIKAVIKSCFQEGSRKLPVQKRRSQVKDENAIRAKCKGSQLKVQRHLRCYQLVKPSTNQDGKVKCNVCSKLIVSKNKFDMAIQHVQSHLKKPMFQCKICPKTCPTYYASAMHAKLRHKASMAGNFEDRSDQFQFEIMNKLEDCFGENGKENA